MQKVSKKSSLPVWIIIGIICLALLFYDLAHKEVWGSFITFVTGNITNGIAAIIAAIFCIVYYIRLLKKWRNLERGKPLIWALVGIGISTLTMYVIVFAFHNRLHMFIWIIAFVALYIHHISTNKLNELEKANKKNETFDWVSFLVIHRF